MKKFDKVSIIGVPMDLGQKRRGVDMGPSAMRYAGLIEEIESLGYDVKDYGDIPINRPAASEKEAGQLRNLEEVIKVSKELCKGVENIESEQSFPLILGGTIV